ADALGGPALVPAGGTLSSTGYTFGAGQGPHVSGAVNASTYSIEMLFSLNSTTGYRKIIDYVNRASDNGLYNLDGAAKLYPIVTASSTVFAPGVMCHLVATRDGATNLFTVYVDGKAALSVTDSNGYAVFTGPNNIAQFL